MLARLVALSTFVWLPALLRSVQSRTKPCANLFHRGSPVIPLTLAFCNQVPNHTLQFDTPQSQVMLCPQLP